MSPRRSYNTIQVKNCLKTARKWKKSISKIGNKFPSPHVAGGEGGWERGLVPQQSCPLTFKFVPASATSFA